MDVMHHSNCCCGWNIDSKSLATHYLHHSIFPQGKPICVTLNDWPISVVSATFSHTILLHILQPMFLYNMTYSCPTSSPKMVIRKKEKCGLWGSNSRPWDYETHALPTEPNSLCLAFKTTLYYAFPSTFISCFHERENQDSLQSPIQLYRRRETRTL